jgi:hypothetical protein
MDFALKLQERTGKGYLSYSSLKYALQDMRLFEMYMAGQLRKESDALTFGSLYDDLLFASSEDVNSKYLVLDDDEIVKEIGGASPRSTKKYKEWLAELTESNNSKTLVKAEDYDMAIDMITRLQDCGILETYLDGQYQVEFNKFIGEIPVRGFLDCLTTDGNIVDLKSARSVSAFKYDAFKFGYDIQAYIYTKVFGGEFYWVAQEKTFPYLPAVFHASQDTIESGRRKFEKAIATISSYLDSREKPTTSFYIFGEI